MLLWTTTVSLCLSAAAAAPAEKPNIVLAMADDQGWGDMAYNGHPVLKTPHFDRMAATPCDSTGSTPPRRSARRRGGA